MYDVYRDPARRAVLINSVIDFLSNPVIKTIGDGLDIDYEYPGGGGVDPDKGSDDDGVFYL